MSMKTELRKRYNTPDALLVVDDGEINREILKNLFSPFYKIEEAENGLEGLEKIKANGQKLCAVLLDVLMPEMGGIEVLRQMNALGLTDSIPVFLITAEASDATMQKAYELGVMDVITKPIVPYVVQRRVNSVVELFRSRKRLGYVVTKQHDRLLQQANKIIKLNQGMVEVLAIAIEFRNGESGGHVRRIHDITRIVLEKTALGNDFTEQNITDISLAAIMHDVGKIAIPDVILNKPGKLTPEEFEVMKTHPMQGAQLLEQIPQMRGHRTYGYALDIACHHHERWAGGGYPDHLKGDEISIWAQVISLADVYDALVSKRVYKDAFDHATAWQMVRRGECGVPYFKRCLRKPVYGFAV